MFIKNPEYYGMGPAYDIDSTILRHKNRISIKQLYDDVVKNNLNITYPISAYNDDQSIGNIIRYFNEVETYIQNKYVIDLDPRSVGKTIRNMEYGLSKLCGNIYYSFVKLGVCTLNTVSFNIEINVRNENTTVGNQPFIHINHTITFKDTNRIIL